MVPPSGPGIVVFGSLNMDLMVRVERAPRGGETLRGLGFLANPGGKGANQAVACARQGARVAMVGCVGADGFGDALRTALAAEGIDAELIDLRSIWPWDREQVLASCARTGRLLVVHEAVQAAGFGAEIAATAAEATGCRVRRLGAPRIPVGYAPVLEAQSRIGVEAIAEAGRTLLR